MMGINEGEIGEDLSWWDLTKDTYLGGICSQDSDYKFHLKVSKEFLIFRF